MANKSSDGSTRMVGIAGVILILLVAYFWPSSDASDSHESELSDEEKLASMLVQGDADSPLDTMRRLKTDANKAVEIAQATTKEFKDYKVNTAEKLEEFSDQLDSVTTVSKREMKEQMGNVMAKLDNFTALMQGQNQASKNKPSPQPSKNQSLWTSIPPVNVLPQQLALVSAGQQPSDNPGAGYNLNNGFLLGNLTEESGAAKPTPLTPVATIPVNSPLLNSITLSTMIGRVPKGGQVFEPFNFYIQTGFDNWTSQDHEIPFLERAIWRGIATGDKDLECIRGALVSVTFVFTDESIQTVEGTRQEPLAELVSTTGSNCVPGTYVSNTGKYIAMYGVGGGIAGLGEAIADNETVSNFNSTGNLTKFVNGNTGNFLAGRSLSAAAAKAAEIIDDEYENSFASVVLESGQSVNAIALKQINIDHNADARKVSYFDSEEMNQ